MGRGELTENVSYFVATRQRPSRDQKARKECGKSPRHGMACKNGDVPEQSRSIFESLCKC
jgi:hypothetical protein